MHEYQKKRLTKWALRKCVILKDILLVVWEEQEPGNWYRWEEKRERAPALQMQFSIPLIIPPGKGKSRKTLVVGQFPVTAAFIVQVDWF